MLSFCLLCSIQYQLTKWINISKLDKFLLGFEYDKTLREVKREIKRRNNGK